jgi:hypothetical protein
MTAVKGHLTAVEFPGEYKQWEYPPPDRLFDAPVLTVIPNVSGTLAFPSHALRMLTPEAGQQIDRQKHRGPGETRQCAGHLDRLRSRGRAYRQRDQGRCEKGQRPDPDQAGAV